MVFATCFSCQKKYNHTERLAYYNANAIQLITKGGITYHDTTPITGVVYALNEKGDSVFTTPYVNGKEYGWSKLYYANGQLRTLRYSENGWKEGEHAGWFENGKKWCKPTIVVRGYTSPTVYEESHLE